ncbi:hypothetical protein HK104_000157 [Borealophlyctis nickersoniae]|nr:hypothetical protein HK104_000157 [Borealophlyctis nickersoniae]
MTVEIRPATAADVPLILRLIKDLALYEKAPEKVLATEQSLHETLFASQPYAHVVIAVLDGVEAGMALYFFNYSTWEGKPGLYLEDLYVAESARRKGVGVALMQHLANIAVEKGCKRFEWMALDWYGPGNGSS